MTVDVQNKVGFLRRHARAIAVAALFAVVGYLSLARLDNTYFWDDEAHVGIIARNYLATGKLTGWDGRNLLAFRDGRLLDDNLNTINPPLEYLLTAGSFRLFGQSTWAGRFPFVVAGLASLAIFGVIVRRDFHDQPALWLYALAVLGFSVVFLLNIRQCRYYATGLLFTLLSYDAYCRCLATDRLTWYLVFALSVIGLFYSNFLFCGAFLGALAVAHLGFHRRELSRKDLWKLGVTTALIVVATVPYAVAHRIWHRPDITNIIGDDPWYRRKPVLLWWNLRDFNVLGLPWMVAAMLAVVLVLTWRKDKNVRRYLEFICLIAGYTAVATLLSPQPVVGGSEAYVRYLLPVVPFLAVLVAAVVHFVHRRRKLLAAAMFLVIVATNLLSANPWGWKFSWFLPAYIHEVHHAYPTAYSEAVAFLRQHARQDDRVFAWPEYTSYPIVFYLGDKVRLCGLLDSQMSLPMEKVEELERAGAPLLRDRHYPDWIVFFGLRRECQSILAYFSRAHGQEERLVRMHYQPVAPLDIFWQATQRPELDRHSFGPKVDFNRSTEAVYIFKGNLVPVEPPTPPTTQPSY